MFEAQRPWAALLLILLCAACDTGEARRPADVILIVVDTLRADALGAYGSDHGSTPRMDAVAGEAVVFERAISAAPWTQPSMASIFAGVYPGVHGVDSYDHAVDGIYRGEPRVRVFDEQFVTLAEALAGHGYDTAGFVANPFLAEDFGFDQGFAHYDTSFARNTTAGDRVNEAVSRWLARRNAERPLFLYLHYMDPHGPYDVGGDELTRLLDRVESLPERTPMTPEERGRLDYLDRPPAGDHDAARHERLSGYREYWEARYQVGVGRADLHVGALLDLLESYGIADDAIVILTSDHGESLCEHGMWDHGSTLFEPELHVPWLIRAPELEPDRRPALVRTIDLMPTVLELVGAPAPDGIQGRSVVGRRAAPENGPAAFAESISIGDEQKAAYDGDWKLMLHLNSGAVALYDLETDPGEDLNAVQPDRDRAFAVRDLLTGQMSENLELRPESLAPPVELTPEQRRRLESLGYL